MLSEQNNTAQDATIIHGEQPDPLASLAESFESVGGVAELAFINVYQVDARSRRGRLWCAVDPAIIKGNFLVDLAAIVGPGKWYVQGVAESGKRGAMVRVNEIGGGRPFKAPRPHPLLIDAPGFDRLDGDQGPEVSPSVADLSSADLLAELRARGVEIPAPQSQPDPMSQIAATLLPALIQKALAPAPAAPPMDPMVAELLRAQLNRPSPWETIAPVMAPVLPAVLDTAAGLIERKQSGDQLGGFLGFVADVADQWLNGGTAEGETPGEGETPAQISNPEQGAQ